MKYNLLFYVLLVNVTQVINTFVSRLNALNCVKFRAFQREMVHFFHQKQGAEKRKC